MLNQQLHSLLSIFPFTLVHLAYALSDPKFRLCDYTSNYTSDSIFSANLKFALNTLQDNTPPTGFNTTTSLQKKKKKTQKSLKDKKKLY